jgi:transcriptional adapter 2-alpha
MLLDGLFMHGMGNWLAVAEFMGSRTKQDVRDHYFKYWIESKNWPLPVSTYCVDHSEYSKL